MTLFDKVLINLHKGFEKLKHGAAFFSERVKVELNIVRMRIRMNEIGSGINELHARIGRRAAELNDGGKGPESFEEFLKDEEVSEALHEIAKLRKELDDINAELARDEGDLAEAAKKSEEKSV